MVGSLEEMVSAGYPDLMGGLVPLLIFPGFLVVCLASLPIKWGMEPILPQEEVMRFKWVEEYKSSKAEHGVEGHSEMPW